MLVSLGIAIAAMSLAPSLSFRTPDSNSAIDHAAYETTRVCVRALFINLTILYQLGGWIAREWRFKSQFALLKTVYCEWYSAEISTWRKMVEDIEVKVRKITFSLTLNMDWSFCRIFGLRNSLK